MLMPAMSQRGGRQDTDGGAHGTAGAAAGCCVRDGRGLAPQRLGAAGVADTLCCQSSSTRLVSSSSARMTKKMIVASAYIFGVTVFFVML